MNAHLHLILFQIIILVIGLLETIGKSITCLCSDHHGCHNMGQLSNMSAPKALSDYAYDTESMGTCEINSNGRCYVSMEVTRDKSFQLESKNSENHETFIVVRYGCLRAHQSSQLACKSHLTNHHIPKTIGCCNEFDLCNKDLNPSFVHYNNSQHAVQVAKSRWQITTTMPNHAPLHSVEWSLVLLMVLSCLLFVFLVSLIVASRAYCRLKKRGPEFLTMTSITGASTVLTMNGSRSKDSEMQLSTTTRDTRLGNMMSMSSSAGALSGNTSGTGGGPTLLVQRTVAKQLFLDQCIGRGRFGEVWTGEWRGGLVAIKLFYPGQLGEKCWRHEACLHRRVLLRHEAVLGLVAADRLAWGSLHRPVVVVDYMARGSLRDLLERYCQAIVDSNAEKMDLDSDWGQGDLLGDSGIWWGEQEGTESGASYVVPSGSQSRLTKGQTQLLKMAQSIVAGITYLHSEIFGTSGKPGIAHRDIKSSNIYVRPDFSLCIGDLCTSVCNQATIRSNQPVGVDSMRTGYCGAQTDTESGMLLTDDFLEEEEDLLVGGLQAGTPRYMAPEVLKESLNPVQFDEFCKSDIYSLGLVFWELVRWAAPVRLLLLSVDQLRRLSYVPPYEDERSALFAQHPQGPEAGAHSNPDDGAEEPPPSEESELFDHDEPTVLEMTELVCHNNIRPRIPENWTHQLLKEEAPVTGALARLMLECWHAEPQHRLTALRIKKTLARVADNLLLISDVHDSPPPQAAAAASCASPGGARADGDTPPMFPTAATVPYFAQPRMPDA